MATTAPRPRWTPAVQGGTDMGTDPTDRHAGSPGGSGSVATGGIKSAHDHACELRLRGAQIETAVLPEGWRWDFFTLEDYGSPSLQVRLDAEGFAVALDIACTSDPEGLFLRLEELRQVARNSKISVVHIGDES